MELANNRIWIGGDQELFKQVQEEAFRLGDSWHGGIRDVSTADDVAWLIFIEKDATGTLIKNMAYTHTDWPGVEEDFDRDSRGKKITLDDMKKMKL